MRLELNGAGTVAHRKLTDRFSIILVTSMKQDTGTLKPESLY